MFSSTLLLSVLQLNNYVQYNRLYNYVDKNVDQNEYHNRSCIKFMCWPIGL